MMVKNLKLNTFLDGSNNQIGDNEFVTFAINYSEYATELQKPDQPQQKTNGFKSSGGVLVNKEHTIQLWTVIYSIAPVTRCTTDKVYTKNHFKAVVQESSSQQKIKHELTKGNIYS
ncbi:unnamed protein product [Sphenostylis stenocarpa]|uniref:Uncharacterized protein n=1 Tax=Sphenostylis stenocarpa TaxID=92480 RepID=A0AA86SHI8_9FABA|nr:unnamed protein product [Sphenostylis stenocarpa]